MKRHGISILLLLVCLYAFASDTSMSAEDESIRRYLEDAFRASAKAEYVSIQKNVGFFESKAADKAIFYRRISSNGEIELRLDLFKGPSLLFTYLQNADGQFAVHHATGLTVKGGCFFRIFHLENMLRPILPSVLDCSEYKREDVNVNGRPCVKVTMTIPSDIQQSAAKLHSAALAFGSLEEMKKRCPVVRVYVIDARTNIIRSRTTYNMNGRKMRSVSLGDVVFFPDWAAIGDELFSSPDQVAASVHSLGDFQSAAFEVMVKSAYHAPQRKAVRWQIQRFLFSGSLPFVFLGVGVISIVAVIILKRKGL